MGPAAGAKPLFPSHPAWSPAFMVSPAQARPETFPNSLESHNGEGSGEALGRGAGSEVDREGPQERGRDSTASPRGRSLIAASFLPLAAIDFANMELSEVVSNAILSAYNGGLLNVNLSSPPAGEAPGPSGAATSPILTSNDALLFHEKCGTLIKLSNNNKTAERRRPLDEFNNGVVMTNRPLRDNEMFEVCRSCGLASG